MLMARKHYSLVATVFDRKGRPIGSGRNEYRRSHPLMKHFAVLAGESPEKIYRHAELSAVLDAAGKDIYSILVQRFDAEGNPALARPCRTCQQMLKAYGVKVVRYTSQDGIVTERNE